MDSKQLVKVLLAGIQANGNRPVKIELDGALYDIDFVENNHDDAVGEYVFIEVS